MPSWAATRRASSAASSEQQLFLNSEYVSATSWRRIQTPTTSWPCSWRSAAATDESTPPDIATRTRLIAAPTPWPERVARRPPPTPIRIEAMTRGTIVARPSSISVVGRRPAERQAERAARLLLRDSPSPSGRGETSVEPVVQAEPTEQAIPSRSSDSATDDAVGVAGDDRQEARQALAWDGRSAPCRRPRGRPSASRSRWRRSRATVSGRSVAGQLVGRGQPDGAGDVLRAGPAVALLLAAVLLGQDVRAVADVQRADALRALELVGGEREQVDAERLDVEVDVRRRLDGVDVRAGRPGARRTRRRSRRSAGSCRPRCWRA